MKGIYLIHNTKVNKVYVGITGKSFGHRWKQHIKLLRRGKHYNKRLQSAYNRDGEESFEFVVLEVYDDVNGIENEELFWVQYFKSIGMELYNLCSYGQYALGIKRSEETKQKLSTNKKKFYANNPAARTEMSNRAKVRMRSSDQIARVKSINAKIWDGFIAPDGTVYKDVYSLMEFCKKHNLVRNYMSLLARGKLETYKGWKHLERG